MDEELRQAWEYRFSDNEATLRMERSQLNAAKYGDGNGLDTLPTLTSEDWL